MIEVPEKRVTWKRYASIALLTLSFNRNNSIKLNTVPESKQMADAGLCTIDYKDTELYEPGIVDIKSLHGFKTQLITFMEEKYIRDKDSASGLPCP